MKKWSRKVRILHYDSNVIVVEKPSGLLIHPYKEHVSEKECLLKIVRNKIGRYLYPIHRLDRPVSGPVLFGLNKESTRIVQANWHHPESIKEYIALVRGHIDKEGSHDFSLTKRSQNGKSTSSYKQSAKTLYWNLYQGSNFALVRVQIKTGRHHQIRRHFSRRCNNLIGDTKYGKGKINQHFRSHFFLHRIFLHCIRLKIQSPGGSGWIDTRCPLPPELLKTLFALNIPRNIVSNLGPKLINIICPD